MIAARERAVDFLRERRGELWCAECVATTLSLRRARIANVFLAIEGFPGFRRADGSCAICRRRRLCMTFETRAMAPGCADRRTAV